MGIGVWELVVILAIVLVIFGTKRLRNIGGDLGGAIKSFRAAMSEGESEQKSGASGDDRVIDSESVTGKKDKP